MYVALRMYTCVLRSDMFGFIALTFKVTFNLVFLLANLQERKEKLTQSSNDNYSIIFFIVPNVILILFFN